MKDYYFDMKTDLSHIIKSIDETARSLIENNLIKNGLKIATAESITSGMVQSAFGKITGASSVFAGGSTAYNINSKVKLFNIDYHHAVKCNCVSRKVAFQMAKGVLPLFSANCGISTTGYAEPNKENGIDHPVAYIGASYSSSKGLRTSTCLVKSKFLDEIVDSYQNKTGLSISNREAFQILVTFSSLKEMMLVLNNPF